MTQMPTPSRPRSSLEAAAANRVLYLLLDAVGDGRTLAWAVAHAREQDPLPAAWARATADGAMRRLLLATGVGLHRVPFCHLACWHEECPKCADAIRGAFPSMTLAAVLAGVRREA